MKDFLTACSLALVIEGVAYALFPGAMRRGLAAMLSMPPGAMRLAGLVTVTAGVAGVWLVRAAIVAP